MPTLPQLRRASDLVLYGSTAFVVFQLVGLVTSALVKAQLIPPALDTIGFALALLGVLGGWCQFAGWRTLLQPSVARTFLDSTEGVRRSLFRSSLAAAALWTLFVVATLVMSLQAPVSSGGAPRDWMPLLRLAAMLAQWIFLISAANHMGNMTAGLFHRPVHTRARLLIRAINVAFFLFIASIAAGMIPGAQPWRPLIQLAGSAAILATTCFYLAATASLRALIHSMRDDDEDEDTNPLRTEPPNPYRT